MTSQDQIKMREKKKRERKKERLNHRQQRLTSHESKYKVRKLYQRHILCTSSFWFRLELQSQKITVKPAPPPHAA